MNEQNLGQFLKSRRESKGLTLRAVENTTGVSNAYLSQLESNKIKQPSPVVLHKLSEALEISYTQLLGLAGYPVPGSDTSRDENVGMAARLGQMSAAEEDAVVEYLEFLRARRDRRGAKK